MQVKVQVQGLCRWSYPSAPGAFRREPAGADLDALRGKLYAPDRLALRLFYLEYVMLPALRAQTDPDFTLHMLLGDGLPGAVRAQVLDLIADVPQIRPVFAPEGLPHQAVCRQVMLAGRDSDHRVVAEFRLDDDDAVSVDFVQMARRSFYTIRRVWHNGGKMALDFNKGYILSSDASGLALVPVSARYWTPGLVLYLRPEFGKSLLDFNHAQMWKRIPTLTHPRQPMFIRGAHGQNDSSVSVRPSNADPDDLVATDLVQTLAGRFAIDAATLDQAWAAHLHAKPPPLGWAC